MKRLSLQLDDLEAARTACNAAEAIAPLDIRVGEMHSIIREADRASNMGAQPSNEKAGEIPPLTEGCCVEQGRDCMGS